MRGEIFLRDNEGNLTAMNEAEYDSESILQELLAKYPQLLAGNQINSENPRKWLLVAREIGIPTEEDSSDKWSLDNLFIDQDAIPTLVEVKRSSDTRIRREVVGQMFDYAANAILYWPVEKIKSLYESECENSGKDPVQNLSSIFNQDIDYDDFWNDVETNLKAGKIRMLFVADEMPAELQRIVEFLNDQMERAEVLAISIKQYVGEGLKTLVPRIIGQTATARPNGTMGPKKKWDEQSFFDDLKKRASTEEWNVAKKIYDWANKKNFIIWFGEGRRTGSFVPDFIDKGTKHQLFAVWSSGYVEIYFYWYQYRKPFDAEEKRNELLKKLNSLEGVSLPEDSIHRRPSIPLNALSKSQNSDTFLNIFEWLIEEIRKYN